LAAQYADMPSAGTIALIDAMLMSTLVSFGNHSRRTRHARKEDTAQADVHHCIPLLDRMRVYG